MSVEADEKVIQISRDELEVRYKTARLVLDFAAVRPIRIESLSLSASDFYERLFADFSGKQLRIFQSNLNKVIFKEDWFGYLLTFRRIKYPWESFRGFGTVAMAVRQVKFKDVIVVDEELEKSSIIDPEGVLFGILHFLPFGDITEADKMRATLAMGTADVLDLISDLKRRRSKIRKLPKYLIGVTNSEMAKFAAKRLGFNYCEFEVEISELAELAQESREEVSDFIMKGLRRVSPVKVIIDTEELIGREAEIRRARDVALKSLERTGVSMRQVRFEAIQGLVKNMLNTDDVKVDERTLRFMRIRSSKTAPVGI